MTDYNVQLEKEIAWEEGYDKGFEDGKNLYKEYFEKYILEEQKCRILLSNALMLTNLIISIIYICSGIVERLNALPTDPYRKLNVLDYTLIIGLIITTVFAWFAGEKYEIQK